MEDLKKLMRKQYLQYASYVILDRAIPDVIDGLKPVQRRILHTLWKLHDGKLHKVANVVGQTMAYHPHGEAAITDALTNMAMKEYLLDKQGNFGNPYTGDPAAAARYIETRLASLALDTMFNPDLTEMIPSYDGRNQEPVTLPAKIPLILLQGGSGIAVGMSTNILPHNFVEVLEAEIAILEGKPFEMYPDFLTGGIADVSQYEKGQGKIKLRTKIEIKDPKTIVIREICHGTTTESLIRSIDEAAKRGKIKIDAINDYTSENVEIEIKLPRGQYANELIDHLYAYTECQVTIHSQMVMIKDERPWETTVDEVVTYHVERLQGYLKEELEIEQGRLIEKIFDKTLEQIFIENRLYKKIEEVATYEKIHSTVEESLKPFHPLLSRLPVYEDRERLLTIPIRKISRFDLEKNKQEIQSIQERLAEVEKELKNIKKVTIRYLKELIKKYGKQFPRKTEIQHIEEIDKRAIATRQVKVGVDIQGGFIGTKVAGDYKIECTNFDKLILFFNNGAYQIINIPEKQFILPLQAKLVYAGIADKQTVFNVIYRDPKTKICFAKRFAVTQFILDKVYHYFDEGMELQYFTTSSQDKLELNFVPKPKQKVTKLAFSFENLKVKGVSAKGIKMASQPVKKISSKSKENSLQMELFSRS